MITVMKFGGTSVGSPDALQRVANIIIASEGEKVVVVSAMSGITNFLVEATEHGTIEKKQEILDQFDKKHMDVATQLFNDEQMKEFMIDYTIRFERFKNLILDDNSSNDHFYKDNVTSQGERFSSLILSHLLRSLGTKSVALTSEDCGIAAEGRPLSGYAVLKKTEAMMTINVKPYIDAGIVPVITGFYGINEDGKPLTFGRGGSDYSAAIIANTLNADLLEIWTDVDGFMSADPRIIPEAIRIDEMNFGEAAELAYFGAKVLHPRTIEPVRMKHIPLKVRNSFKPEEPGTLIHHLRKTKDELLRSVAIKTDLSIIAISSAEIAFHPKMVARIIEKIAENDVIIYSISTSLSTVAFLVHNNDVKTTLMKLNSLNPKDIERIEVKSDVALVCAVGDNLLAKCGVSGDIFTAVKEANANVEMISEGASDVSLNFVVPMAKVTDVVKILHNKYVGGDIQ
ncbi:MAG: aspartate kinase [Candidatus Methanomethylophilaceae archaeon]|nr:aspartate kinase [Candidatus Methanomethylophilaceae archaeon]MDD3379091.1 aspartate kinase [Candidatus Methanomethylophilaceae archaeon]MDY0224522.1 aspartate kinase [Candidatus Methanomethylophilaceae archaeon]